jgi:hypothetical protein
MIPILDELEQALPNIKEYCEIQIKENPYKDSTTLELEPINENGKENIFILGYENHVTLSYDYYERRFDIDGNSSEHALAKVFDIVEKIITEQFISVTTYSADINLSKVSDLYEPSKAKKIRRRKNFRARSWSGTYDDDCT